MRMIKIGCTIFIWFMSIATIAQAQENFPGGKGESIIWDNNISVHEFKDGNFTWRVDGKLMVEGKYTIQGKYLIVTDLSGPRSCHQVEMAVGIYTWEIFKEKIYLKVIEDECLGRQNGFQSISLG